eukprot:5659887-Pleurochrysis_carterae.AAC.1
MREERRRKSVAARLAIRATAGGTSFDLDRACEASVGQHVRQSRPQAQEYRGWLFYRFDMV